MSKWLEALQRCSESTADKIPAGFKTRQQLQSELQLCKTQAAKIVSKLTAAGLVEKKTFRIVSAGCVRPIPHYRLSNEAKRLGKT